MRFNSNCFNTPLAFEPQEDDAKANDDDGATRIESTNLSRR